MATKRKFRKILTFLGGGDLLVEWGGELPRGVLLYGEAGAGKTHLARALAGEADVPFYAPPMSLIFDMYVGNSERNVRNLFRRPRNTAARSSSSTNWTSSLPNAANPARPTSRGRHDSPHACSKRWTTSPSATPTSS